MKGFIRLLSLIILSGGILSLGGCKKQPPAAPEEPAVSTAPDAAVPDGQIQMAIYYAGHPGSKREKDFARFLGNHFIRIQTGDLAAYNGRQSKGFDVTILDYDGDGFKSPRPEVPRDLTSPVVTMGVTGAFISGRLNLKTDYL